VQQKIYRARYRGIGSKVSSQYLLAEFTLGHSKEQFPADSMKPVLNNDEAKKGSGLFSRQSLEKRPDPIVFGTRFAQ